MVTFAHGFVDWRDQPLPIPDTGKFGFRVVGADVKIDVEAFRVRRIERPQSLCGEDPAAHLQQQA